jgi:hypothetical protein
VSGWQIAALAHAGVNVFTGMRLHQTYLDAGLSAPEMMLYGRVGGSRAFIEGFTAGAAETVRSLLPVLIKAGITSEQEVGIDTLAARYRDDLLERGSVIRAVLFMGAWAHKA